MTCTSFSDAALKANDALLSKNAAAFQKLANDGVAMKAISADPRVFSSIAANAGAFKVSPAMLRRSKV